MARAPDTAELVKKLGQQHKQGEQLFVEMLKALSAYEFSGNSEFPGFREAVLEYTQLEREHVIIEERDLLPRALEALEASDWKEIDAAFSENQDPMFGEKWDSDFSDLLNKLVNRLPAPLGLGDVWK
jgi:branched-chain amino acid transport system ATP-binding protein